MRVAKRMALARLFRRRGRSGAGLRPGGREMARSVCPAELSRGMAAGEAGTGVCRAPGRREEGRPEGGDEGEKTKAGRANARAGRSPEGPQRQDEGPPEGGKSEIRISKDETSTKFPLTECSKRQRPGAGPFRSLMPGASNLARISGFALRICSGVGLLGQGGGNRHAVKERVHEDRLQERAASLVNVA